MTISWPGTLPQRVLIAGYSRTTDDNLLRSPTDIGPPKVRRRFTAVATRVPARIFVTAAQLATFKTFYFTTSLSGSLRFSWYDPDDGSTAAEIRFVSPPVWAPAGSDDNFYIDMDLEIMP